MVTWFLEDKTSPFLPQCNHVYVPGMSTSYLVWVLGTYLLAALENACTFYDLFLSGLGHVARGNTSDWVHACVQGYCKVYFLPNWITSHAYCIALSHLSSEYFSYRTCSYGYLPKYILRTFGLQNYEGLLCVIKVGHQGVFACKNKNLVLLVYKNAKFPYMYKKKVSFECTASFNYCCSFLGEVFFLNF